MYTASGTEGRWEDGGALGDIEWIDALIYSSHLQQRHQSAAGCTLPLYTLYALTLL